MTTLLTNLTYYWKFDEGVGSTVYEPSMNNGTWSGTLGSQWTAGKIGKGGQFNGSDNYVQIATVPPTGLTAMSISAWCFPTSYAQENAAISNTGSTIVESNETGSGQGWVLGIRNDGKIWYWPAGNADTFSTNSIPLNKWTHIVLVWDGSANVSMYINGVLDSVQATVAQQSGATFFRIGGRGWVTGFWAGILDEIGIWNTTALTQAQVTQLYNNGAGLQYPFNVPFFFGGSW